MNAAMPLVITLLVATAGNSADKLDAPFDLSEARSLIVQHDGRCMPLDTLARDVVHTVGGRSLASRRDPVLWLLAWTFEPDRWRRQPLIPIGNAQLREELALAADKTAFSYDELIRHQRLQDLLHQIGNLAGNPKPDPLQSKVREIRNRLATLNGVFGGQTIRLVPDPSDPGAAWEPLGTAPPHGTTLPAAAPANLDWSALRDAFIAGNATSFAQSAAALRSKLDALPAAYRPAPRLIDTELLYNRLRPFRVAWIIMVAGAVLAALAAIGKRRWLTVLAVLGLIAGFATLTYGLSLRWAIAGRIPASNMYESLLFLSWGMGAFAILSMLAIRDRFVPLTASFMGALALLLADNLPLDPFIRPITPVLLDTVWMTIHVPIIMVSYSVLALAALIAHAQLVTMAVIPDRRQVCRFIDALHYWYIHVGCILLGAGIVTGSMWAASSWGRYWGWDPKEVWSLVAFLAYVAILHRRADRERPSAWICFIGLAVAAAVVFVIATQLNPTSNLGILALVAGAASVPLFAFARGPFADALKSTLAFWLIIMTYVGVNYILGMGLHSYAFGTGAVARYLFLIGGIDLGLIGLCTIAYLARRRPTSEPAGA